MISASCHCGSVRLEFEDLPESLTECNCSLCHRYGAQWAYFRQDQVRVISSENGLSAYIWGDEKLEFFHCVKCGCLTHYESVEKSATDCLAINARMMRSVDVAGLAIRLFDGANTWKYIGGS